ncbi:hypothetical protein C3L33_19244, partial [Rhododendron williamsianum]
MAAKASSVIMPIVSKVYCSPSQVILVVRRRPHVVHGGGFVVTNCTQKVVFRVDGCGILGKDGEVVVRDAEGDSLLLIRRKIGIRKDVEEMMMGSRDLYHVIVKPGIDQAFVFGVIAVLDYIYDGSTRC